MGRSRRRRSTESGSESDEGIVLGSGSSSSSSFSSFASESASSREPYKNVSDQRPNRRRACVWNTAPLPGCMDVVSSTMGGAPSRASRRRASLFIIFLFVVSSLPLLWTPTFTEKVMVRREWRRGEFWAGRHDTAIKPPAPARHSEKDRRSADRPSRGRGADSRSAERPCGGGKGRRRGSNDGVAGVGIPKKRIPRKAWCWATAVRASRSSFESTLPAKKPLPKLAGDSEDDSLDDFSEEGRSGSLSGSTGVSRSVYTLSAFAVVCSVLALAFGSSFLHHNLSVPKLPFSLAVVPSRVVAESVCREGDLAPVLSVNSIPRSLRKLDQRLSLKRRQREMESLWGRQKETLIQSILFLMIHKDSCMVKNLVQHRRQNGGGIMEKRGVPVKAVQELQNLGPRLLGSL
uniref:Transmembrane protein n=1 Tax=Chromera velia CCMP2878 TaxID=1169474 RepID=A0A0G4H4R6_9ALVE|eukprot:Cvel_24675.t1-p1 / transcript=Cvel_24675.t1 / gene=Cvel_24675 / organism=Chromera_velia_CCMP2878 / gene_product=hypothetical protein / transcript_product=hypothetical protein / location=Cvel_scaffold2701:18274-21450(-) / protein_length=403 / sequence_SO=supercontig / SO=protein_coding / is_pseudo=false